MIFGPDVIHANPKIRIVGESQQQQKDRADASAAAPQTKCARKNPTEANERKHHVQSHLSKTQGNGHTEEERRERSNERHYDGGYVSAEKRGDLDCAWCHSHLPTRITDPAPVTSDLKLRRYRGVRCIRFVRLAFRIFFYSLQATVLPRLLQAVKRAAPGLPTMKPSRR